MYGHQTGKCCQILCVVRDIQVRNRPDMVHPSQTLFLAAKNRLEVDMDLMHMTSPSHNSLDLEDV